MKKHYAIFALLLQAIVSSAQTTPTKITPPLYLEFVMHNEASDLPAYDGDRVNYNSKRSLVKQFADSIHYKGAKLNFQSDYKFLNAVYKFDDASTMASTNSKNLIKWMQSDNNNQIELDCHSHQDAGNYTDVYYYYRHIGVTPSKNVGGFVYDTVLNASIPGSNWFDLQTPLIGKNNSDSAAVQFDVLWGGNSGKSGAGGHDAPAAYYGVFYPDTITNFFHNNPTRHLLSLGNGCDNELGSSTEVTTVMSNLRSILSKMQSGEYSKKGFYYTRIMMNVRDLNAAMLTKVGQLIDSIRPYTTPSVNKIQWKTISETVNAWRVQYSAKPFEWGCDSTAKVPGASLAHRLAKEVETVEKLLPIDASIHYKMYPNPASNVVTVNGQNQKLIQKISIYDLMGKLVLEDPTINSFQYEMQISQLPQGTYRLQIFDTSQTVTGITFIKQ